MIIHSFPWGNHTLELGQIIKHGGEIFDFEYPFYDEAHRKEFERKFLLHFRYHEIGQESLQRFKYMLQDTLTLNYPKYLHYYKVKLKADEIPWWDNKNTTIDETKKVDSRYSSDSNSDSKTNSSTLGHSNSSSTDTNTSNDSSTNTNKFLDTPQGRIENLEEYLTTANKNTENSSSSSTDKSTNSSDSNSATYDNTSSKSNSNNNGVKDTIYHREEHGNVGVTTAGGIVGDWLKKAYINVDQMIMDDCEELFMQVY